MAWMHIEEDIWQAQRQQHSDTVSTFLTAHLARKTRGIKHPLNDFLFEYYRFRPSYLARWSPGTQVLLLGDSASEQLKYQHFKRYGNGVGISAASFPEQRMASLEYMKDLQATLLNRACMYHCFNLHEWAMVYEAKDIRHPQLGLRLPHSEVREVVESLPIQCTHYDAFRFFSDSAKPLNQKQPCANRRVEDEQPGCLHVIMDLYKWASKCYPWVSSSRVWQAFSLALEARTLDMRASPYDVAKLGLEPLLIETPKGREQWIRLQREIAQKAMTCRQALHDDLLYLQKIIKKQTTQPLRLI